MGDSCRSDSAFGVTGLAHEEMSLDSVREIALSLPDVQDATTARAFALKLGGRLLACQPTHKSAEPNSLMVRTPINERDVVVIPANMQGFDLIFDSNSLRTSGN